MPWVDDPDTGTSYYERPKKARTPKAGSLADLANQFNDDVTAAQVEDTTFDGQPLPVEETFGQRMARLKREKAARIDAAVAKHEAQA